MNKVIEDQTAGMSTSPNPSYGCICGGQMILGPFGPYHGDDVEEVIALNEAIFIFCRGREERECGREGGTSEDTIAAWVEMREQVAWRLRLILALEGGIASADRDANGVLRWNLRPPR
jgi:hypothetical protein